MRYQRIFIILFGLALIQGCTMFENGYSSSANNFNNPYDNYDVGEQHYEGNVNQPRIRRSGELDDELPVQMTKQDDNLQTLKPEVKQEANKDSNKKVLLPISGTLE